MIEFEKFFDIDSINNCIVLKKDFSCKIKIKNNELEIIIPEGYVFDGMTMPEPLTKIFGARCDYKYLKASCIHDFLYDYLSIDEYKHITRRQADDIFYYLLVEQGNSKFKSFIMWLIIRMFGSPYFRKNYY